jgi:DNA-binding CsgD family transcriptional regulator
MGILLPYTATRVRDDEEIDYDSLPEADVIVNYTNERLKKGLGTNIFVIGLSGTGKSSVSLRLGELIKQSRDDKPSILQSDSVFKLVKNVRASKEGDIIVIEEISVLFPSRRAMSGDNVDVGSIFDTIRKKMLVLISNCPLWTTVDSHMKALGHLLVETLKINKTQSVVISKFHRLQTNPRSGNTYFHTMVRDGTDIRLMYTRLPEKGRWEDYEKEKDEFMDRLYTKLEAKQKKKIEKENKELGIDQPTWENRPEDRKKLTDKQRRSMELLANNTYKVTAEKMGVTIGTIKNNKKLAEKKGYCLEEFEIKEKKAENGF